MSLLLGARCCAMLRRRALAPPVLSAVPVLLRAPPHRWTSQHARLSSLSSGRSDHSAEQLSEWRPLPRRLVNALPAAPLCGNTHASLQWTSRTPRANMYGGVSLFTPPRLAPFSTSSSPALLSPPSAAPSSSAERILLLQERLRKLRRWKVIATATALAILLPLLVVKEWRERARLAILGAARFSRAIYTVLAISLDYKYHFWKYGDLTQEENEAVDALLSQVHLRAAKRLLYLSKANGGVYIKAGQHIGALDYLVPVEYVKTLRVLHDAAPFSELAALEKTFVDDIGLKFDDVFEYVEPAPVGAASLAQVHRAKLKGTGEIVAVKIQHPDVFENSRGDMDTIDILTRVVAFIFPAFKFVWLAEETRRNLPKELNFEQEGHNADHVASLFKDSAPFLSIPKIHWHLTSPRVLVMEFCQGGKVDDLEYIVRNGINPNDVSRKLKRIFSDMMFRYGWVHCDPHPGNILVRRRDKQEAFKPKSAFARENPAAPEADTQGSLPPTSDIEIVLLDHGLYQQLSSDFRMDYCGLWKALIDRSEAGIRRYSQRLGVGDLYQLFACVVTARAWDAVTTDLASPMTFDELDHVRANAAFYFVEITRILNQVPRPLLLLLKTNDLLRSVDRSLQTSGAANGFSEVAKSCLHAIREHELEQHRASRLYALYWIREKLLAFAYDVQIGVYDSFLNVKHWVRQVRRRWRGDVI